jgi:membrane fusion protein, multidrug efflux system
VDFDKNMKSLAALAITIGGLVLAGCGKPPPPMTPPPIEAGVLRVEPQSVPLTREFAGRLSATRSADVRARVAGVLQRRLYTEGTEVKAGQPLFQIDPTPLQAELDGALAALARAEAEATNAQVVARRARKLVVDRLLSQAEVDTAEAAERSTGAQVKQAQADVQTARIRLGYAKVVAPIAGRAGQQRVTEGALVGQDDATLLTVIEQIDPIYVNFEQPAAVLEQLLRAQSSGDVTLLEQNKAQLQVLLAGGDTYGETGVVDFSGTSVDPSTGTVAFRGTIPNPDRRLLPGLFVNVRLSLGQRNNVYLVPQVAVLRDAVGPFVWTVGEGNRAAQKRIRAEFMQGPNWVVSEGLAAGDQILVSGISSLRPDAPVKPVPVQPPTTPNEAPANTAPARTAAP